MSNYLTKIKEAVAYIESKTDYKPEIGLILGSGLGSLADQVEDAVVLPYGEIPNFPQSNVVGHAGNLVIGKLEGKVVIALQGRMHFYEGESMQTITIPTRIMQLMGVKKLIVTNACGGINIDTLTPGDLMLISDHINLMGTSPLIGENIEELGTRFPDMSEPYSKELRAIAREAGSSLGLTLKEGVYAGWMGPAYETPAEIRYIRTIGADAVGMSTVPEVIVANHAQMQVLGISCITNMACGILDQKLGHHEVMEVANRVHKDFVALVRNVINKM
ncbi:purine-nucleoside phosphorylase [Culicoidibacter larvae]|uniref:Purine nucleoside phosphorylase n=1 Tax=Culicoidibacter larvae TaxID=2579976 RepID=A0A5R8Q938_9FIRM|nr:purine-nucleoside phosphorylase [Culicoidibacter larvae]TLG71803.1 purine-nucleoside phosphorylase [Culicoidibacter larvae]